MKQFKICPLSVVVVLFLTILVEIAFGLSIDLSQPKIFFPKDYNPSRVEAVQSVLTAPKLKFLGGLTSYWEPEWATTLVYEGNQEELTEFLGRMNEVKGMNVRLTFSKDLSKETGSALHAGSWWVMYSHTMPDTITIRVNLASTSLGGDKFGLILPKSKL